MARNIGIDLGTTNSVVAYIENGRSECVPNSEGRKTTPSVVMLKEEGPPVVGELAKRQLVTHPRSVIRSVKRVMGKRFSEVRDSLSDYPYEIIEGSNDSLLIQLDGGRKVLPEEISAEVLQKMVSTAEDFLGEDINQAVVTVPAHFNDGQRVATKRAAEMAGLDVLRIINEPTAAALAYGLGRSQEEKIAVFDFGGGTFDITLLQLAGGIFEVLSTNGDNMLGGDNLDMALAQWISRQIREETGCDPEADLQAKQRIFETAEKVKCELSTLSSTIISLPFIVADASGPKHFNREITREQFITLVRPLLDRLRIPCEQAFKDASLKPDRIANVVLVGGSSRIPAVQDIVRELFGREPNRSVNPDEAVALGAAIQAGVITGELEEILLLDVVPLSLGIELAGGLFKPLIARNSNIPTTANRRFTTVVDNQRSVMVHVLQGERSKSKENRTLARFRLSNISLAPREVPEIDVRFHVDANGILEVTAQDLTSGAAQSVLVEDYTSSISSETEIQRLVQDAQSHVDEDRGFEKNIQHFQQIEHVRHSMGKFLHLVADDISEADHKKIKETMLKLDLVRQTKKWIEIDVYEAEYEEIRKRYRAAYEAALRSLQNVSTTSGEGRASATTGAEETPKSSIPPGPAPPSTPSREMPQASVSPVSGDSGNAPPPPSAPEQAHHEEDIESFSFEMAAEEEASGVAVPSKPVGSVEKEIPSNGLAEPQLEDPLARETWAPPPSSEIDLPASASDAAPAPQRPAGADETQVPPLRPIIPSQGTQKKFTPPSWLVPRTTKKPDGSQ